MVASIRLRYRLRHPRILLQNHTDQCLTQCRSRWISPTLISYSSPHPVIRQIIIWWIITLLEHIPFRCLFRMSAQTTRGLIIRTLLCIMLVRARFQFSSYGFMLFIQFFLWRMSKSIGHQVFLNGCANFSKCSKMTLRFDSFFMHLPMSNQYLLYCSWYLISHIYRING